MRQIDARKIQILITLDICWSLIALVYDWHKLATMSPVIWFFAAICPLYPALLAISWHHIRNQKSQNWIVGFSANATATFGLIALVYYPLYMYYSHTDFVSLLSIPWLWFYAAQGWYIIWHYKISSLSIFFSGLFLLVSFTSHWQNYSFGFFDTKIFPPQIYNALFGLIAVFIITTAALSVIKQNVEPSCR